MQSNGGQKVLQPSRRYQIVKGKAQHRKAEKRQVRFPLSFIDELTGLKSVRKHAVSTVLTESIELPDDFVHLVTSPFDLPEEVNPIHPVPVNRIPEFDLQFRHLISIFYQISSDARFPAVLRARVDPLRRMERPRSAVTTNRLLRDPTHELIPVQPLQASC